MVELSEIVEKIVRANLAPDQIGNAAEIVSLIQAGGFTPEQVKAALVAALEPPAAPVPEWTAEQWAAWLAAQAPAPGDPHEACMVAYRAEQAADGPATYAAVMVLWRRIKNAKPELAQLYSAEQKAAQAAKETK